MEGWAVGLVFRVRDLGLSGRPNRGGDRNIVKSYKTNFIKHCLEVLNSHTCLICLILKFI